MCMCVWQVLGVSKTANQKEIKVAYYKAAKEWHPDKNPGPEAEDKFKAISDAYGVRALKLP